MSTHGAKIRREARASRRQTLSHCARAELRLRRPRLGTRGTAAAAAKLICLQASSHRLSTLQTGRRCAHWRCAHWGWTRRRLRSAICSNGGRVGRAAVHHTFCADRAAPPPALTVARSAASRCMARRAGVSEGGRDRPWAASGAGWRTVAVVRGARVLRGRISAGAREPAPLGSLSDIFSMVRKLARAF